MIYYRKIPWDNLPALQEKTIAYLTTKRPDILNRAVDASYWTMHDREILKWVPEINAGAAKYGLVCDYTAAFVMHRNGDGPLHIDNFKFDTRINFPILNCVGTRTQFYTGTTEDGVRHYSPMGSTAGTTVKIPKTASTVLLDEVEVDCVTVLRVNTAHSIWMPPNALKPRITLTLGFDKDPTFLLDADLSSLNTV